MNQIAATLLISYGTAYGTTLVSRYFVNKITEKVVDKTTETITNSVKSVLYTKQPNNTPIEYEYILVDKENNDVIVDEMRYVTSKEKRPSIDQSWTDLD